MSTDHNGWPARDRPGRHGHQLGIAGVMADHDSETRDEQLPARRDWESPLHDIVKSTLDPLIRANYKDRYGAAVGYLAGLPKG